jgi:DNA polymerase-1
MSKIEKEKLVIIDANALVHRAFHALPPLSSQEGELTNAVFGFTSILIKVINEIKPDYMVACFDLPEPTFRHKEFDQYKAHRAKTPEDLIPQFEKVKQVLKAFNVPIFEKAGFEADDLLGTISLLSRKQNKNIKNIILTGDLDTLQLVNDNTFIYTLKKGITDTIIYDEKAVIERFGGLKPEQMIDFKGLKGDPSDNIPGVPGIGEKTAIKLLLEYKTLEGIYENIGLIKKNLADKLLEYKDQAFFSKKLSIIILDIDVDFDLKDAKFGDYDKNKVIKIFKELNFFTLISRLSGTNGWENDRNGEVKENEVKIREITEEDILSIEKKKEIVVSIFKSDVYVSCIKKEVLKASPEKIKSILENDDIRKIGYDLKNIIKFLDEVKISLNGPHFDIMIAAYLLAPGLRGYDLQKIIFENLGKDVLKDEIEKMQIHLFEDVKNKLEKKLEDRGLKKIFLDIEMPLIKILADMEKIGIKLNIEKIKDLSEKLTEKIKEKEKEIFKISKREFNINSPAQLGVILFEELKIQGDKKTKKTKTGAYSTGESELEKFRKDHKIISLILQYREFAKLKNTYLDTLPILVDKKTERLHTTFNQTATVTGRISSSEPNLQNIPQRGEFSKNIRSAFEAEDGFSLIAFDYSQIELRIIASISNDENMIEIFKNSGDIHTATAAVVSGVSEGEVTKKMRNAAKVLNFGILFGMSIKSFAATAEIDMHEAKIFIENYFLNFPKIKKFIEKTLDDAKKKGFVETELGRKRWLPDLKSQNWILRHAAERMAQNMPAQGLEADILKLAIIKIDENILQKQKSEDVRLVLQIHDELIFEIKDGIIENVKEEIKSLMESAYKLKVPLVIDITKGKNWGNMSAF